VLPLFSLVGHVVEDLVRHDGGHSPADLVVALDVDLVLALRSKYNKLECFKVKSGEKTRQSFYVMSKLEYFVVKNVVNKLERFVVKKWRKKIF
jgi:hypothetical protein